MHLDVDGVCFSYRGVRALDDVSFKAEKGEVVALLGPNGAGKTTLLKCLNRILEPGGGAVAVDGVDMHGLSLRGAAKQMGYVAQRGETSRTTVFDAVLLGRRPYIEWGVGENDLRITERILKTTGLDRMALRYIDEISGGEYQMVQIARALAQQPKVLLMDEPTSSLDIANQHMVMRLVRNVVKRNDMVAVITMHDLNLAVRYSDG
ncbi:MAG: ABC transporter ATP-binding protein, partial [Candidatus Methanoplasma sp.]|nr:ABC transporter ATP-binding protein [Candidatus Methanoplasma sp.]